MAWEHRERGPCHRCHVLCPRATEAPRALRRETEEACRQLRPRMPPGTVMTSSSIQPPGSGGAISGTLRTRGTAARAVLRNVLAAHDDGLQADLHRVPQQRAMHLRGAQQVGTAPVATAGEGLDHPDDLPCLHGNVTKGSHACCEVCCALPRLFSHRIGIFHI